MARKIEDRFSGVGKSLVQNSIALGFFSIVIIFSQAAYLAEWRSNRGLGLNALLKVDENTTIAVVQAFQVMLLALTTTCLDEAFEFLHWTLMDTSRGIPYQTFLALSPATGYMGTLSLIFAWPIRSVPVSTRLWGLLK